MAAIQQLVAAELGAPVQPEAVAVGEAIAARYPGAARAVLFYGSCLRETRLDGLMLDFYLIVSDYRAAYGKSWLAAANRLLPPNVFPFEHNGLAAKYAVLSEEDFARECSARASTVSVWARFAQPSRLVWAADASAREHCIAAIAEAAPILFSEALPLHPHGHDHPLQTPLAALPDALDFWRFAFSLTYGAELRAERRGRGGSVVDADPERYRRFTGPALARISPNDLRSPAGARRHWRKLRFKGKLLTVARLAKASFTFAGGIDYLAWKINRHAGTDIRIAPWQRRWPLIGALTLLPRLLRRGAIR
jgi:hypothetical protein